MNLTHKITLTASLLIFSAACGTGPEPDKRDTALSGGAAMDSLAERYLELALAMGEHDPDYIDAYYGTEDLRDRIRDQALPLASIKDRIAALRGDLAKIAPTGMESGEDARLAYLKAQCTAMDARAEILTGAALTFDEEAKRIYDTEPPKNSEAFFKGLLEELDGLLPGEVPLQARVEAFQKGFVIAPEKLDAVFRAAIEEARRRIPFPLPEGENFTVEYVTGKPWSGYNWYKGDYQSLIQVNTDLPITIDRAIDLACHEGYPGHHVYNVLLEHHLVRGRNWREFTVYPLFSPQSLIAEGTANFGIQVAFPIDERLRFEKEVLFPLAGLDPEQAERYYRVQAVLAKLKYAGNEAARGYLDGELSGEDAVDWLVRYALMTRPKAEQRLKFIEKYRAYVINYNHGEDLVSAYVAAHGGGEDNPGARWRIFEALISTPRIPSELEAR